MPCCIGEVGRNANPLGSNLANIYLVVLIAPLWIANHRIWRWWKIEVREFHLVRKHVLIAALGLWIFSTIAMSGLVESNGSAFDGNAVVQTPLALCAAGFIGFPLVGTRIDVEILISTTVMMDSAVLGSLAATAEDVVGLGISSAAINWLFLAVSSCTKIHFSQLFGVRIFAYLHYFVGALVTSLPELTVATRALRRRYDFFKCKFGSCRDLGLQRHQPRDRHAGHSFGLAVPNLWGISGRGM